MKSQIVLMWDIIQRLMKRDSKRLMKWFESKGIYIEEVNK